MNSCNVLVCLAVLFLSYHHVQAQKSEETLSSGNNQDLAANFGPGNEDVLVLMPTTSLSTNNSQTPYESNSYNLFKLDTEVLNNRDKEAATSSDEESASTTEDDRLPLDELKNGHRSSRKINFLRGMWNKPKISPLYLVNGTVCRFVNSRPICTTLSTTGLLPTNSSATTSGQFGGNGQVRLQGSNQQPFMGNQQFMGNQPMMDNQQQPYQNMIPQQQQFLNNQNPSMSRQQPQRPFSALIQDEVPSEVNIGTSESSLNASETSSSIVLPKVQQAATAATITPISRPMAALQRRPSLNLLSLRRPLRLASGKAL